MSPVSSECIEKPKNYQIDRDEKPSLAKKVLRKSKTIAVKDETLLLDQSPTDHESKLNKRRQFRRSKTKIDSLNFMDILILGASKQQTAGSKRERRALLKQKSLAKITQAPARE